MATWTGVVTNGGKALFATWVDGTTFNFDAAEGGTGTVSESVLMAQTALVNKKQNISILAAQRVIDGIKLTIQIVAPAVGYTLNQIGIKGSVDGGASALTALFQNATGITIPSSTQTPDFIYKFFGTIIVSNTGTFSLTIDTSALVSQSTLDTAMATKQGKITATGMLVGDGSGGVTAAVAGVDYGFPLPSGTTDPTPSTVGLVGQHYFNTATGEEFVCAGESGGSYVWKKSGASSAEDISVGGQPLSAVLGNMQAGIDDATTLTGTTDPSGTTAGAVGQLYLNTTSGNTFVCTEVDGGAYTWKATGTTPVLPQIKVTAPSGAVVTCSSGATILTATSTGTATFDIPRYGDWTVQATQAGKTSNTEIITVDAVKQYSVALMFFTATLTVTSETGALVTATDGVHSYTGTGGADGKCAITIRFSGTYTVSASKNGATSSSVSKVVATDGGSYTATVSFCTLTVNIDTGSAVTATNGGTTLNGTSAGGLYKFYLPNTGTWEVTASLSGETTGGSVDAAAYQGYTLDLSYVRIFGVVWDYANTSTALARLTKANDPNGLVTVNITTEPVAAVGTGAGSSPFDSYAPWSGMEEYNIISEAVSYKRGQAGFDRAANDTAVFIPEYYFKIVDNAAANKRYLYVADKAKTGFTKHPGSGKYVGRYNTGAGHVSKAGIPPLATQTRASFRTGARNKGAGLKWSLHDYASWCAVWLLYLVEFADWDSQARVGRGYVDGNSAAINCGGTDTMAYHTGRAAGEDGKTAVQYRNIENPWGNVHEWIDGANFNERAAYICLDRSKYADDTATGYTAAGITLSESGWIKQFGVSAAFPWAFLPTVVGGSETTYIADRLYSDTGWRVLRVGGNWDYGSYAGLFYFSADYDSSNSDAYIGARLLFHP